MQSNIFVVQMANSEQSSVSVKVVHSKFMMFIIFSRIPYLYLIGIALLYSRHINSPEYRLNRKTTSSRVTYNAHKSDQVRFTYMDSLNTVL